MQAVRRGQKRCATVSVVMGAVARFKFSLHPPSLPTFHSYKATEASHMQRDIYGPRRPTPIASRSRMVRLRRAQRSGSLSNYWPPVPAWRPNYRYFCGYEKVEVAPAGLVLSLLQLTQLTRGYGRLRETTERQQPPRLGHVVLLSSLRSPRIHTCTAVESPERLSGTVESGTFQKSSAKISTSFLATRHPPFQPPSILTPTPPD